MSNIQTGAERMPHDLSHLGFLAGQIGRLITISTTPVIAGDSFEMDAAGALRLSPLRRGLAIDFTVDIFTFYVFFFSSKRRHTILQGDWEFRRVLFRSASGCGWYGLSWRTARSADRRGTGRGRSGHSFRLSVADVHRYSAIHRARAPACYEVRQARLKSVNEWSKYAGEENQAEEPE